MALSSLDVSAVAVIGSDDKIFFTGVRDDVLEVVVRLRLYVNVAIAYATDGNRLRAAEGATHRFVHDPGHPLARRLDEPPAKPRKQARQLAHDQRIACVTVGTRKVEKPPPASLVMILKRSGLPFARWMIGMPRRST